MKYLKKYNENIENDYDFVIAKIVDHFPYDDVKMKIDSESDELDKETALLDMICWFETQFDRNIEDEDYVMQRLRDEYNIQ
jgi:hypothetical protein